MVLAICLLQELSCLTRDNREENISEEESRVGNRNVGRTFLIAKINL